MPGTKSSPPSVNEAARQELHAAQAALQESEARHRHLFEHAAVGIYRTTPDGRILAANPALLRMLGFTEFAELAQHNLETEGMMAGNARRDFKLRMERDGEALGIEAVWVPRPGRMLHVRESARAVHDGNDKILYYEGTVEDITALKRTEAELKESYDRLLAANEHNLRIQAEQISRMALHDELTGLPNRLLLEDRLQQALLLARLSGKKVGVGIIDLDQFKQINERLGFKAGDQVLRALAGRMDRVLRGSVTLCRWGGDEFALLLPEIHEVSDAIAAGEALLEAAREPLVIEGREVYLSYSIGFAVFPDHGDAVETLLSRADAAVGHAKKQGRNLVQTYNDVRISAPEGGQLELQGKLHQALQHRAIQVFYQPVVDAATGRVTSVEALARWHDPEAGWISPARFIPMAEDFGIMHELGRQIIERTLSQLQAWRAEGRSLRVAMNLSKRQLFSPTFVTEMRHSITDHGLTPDDLILEITEGIATLDVEGASGSIQALADAGFRLSMDDFGTGYSSLSQLHKIPVSDLKIDISFIRRLQTPDGNRVVNAIIQMAQALRLNVVAEGVEDEKTGRRLIEMGVNDLQGFHYCRPLPGAEITAFLDRDPNASTPAVNETGR